MVPPSQPDELAEGHQRSLIGSFTTAVAPAAAAAHGGSKAQSTPATEAQPEMAERCDDKTAADQNSSERYAENSVFYRQSFTILCKHVLFDCFVCIAVPNVPLIYQMLSRHQESEPTFRHIGPKTK